LTRIAEDKINFMGIEMIYKDLIAIMRAIEQAKAEVRELLKKDDMK